ncbi:MAG: tRNA lysidine(34) synthetase TilS [Kordiimonadaceae bacterium]|jgi:tRNA(Ile)-lysidine synthase|nr:tRNA lysidine(34) synthetase TilS [Kordiimonadaceae bacterium]MBT6031122.1 tRNA lysidine(34) synthetase TilS [Kordiimonadaceae bacterium]
MQLEEEIEPSPLTSDEFHNLMAALNLGATKYIAVAVSGGGDSMALCLLLKAWCASEGINLTALTVDHGLRENSHTEAEQVGKWLAEVSIAHHILSWEGDKPTTNIQDEARKARYKLMGNWCVQNNVDYLCLAHHQDDQAETFLLRLFRGSGVDGLSAMEEKADFPVNGNSINFPVLCRPLLDIAKSRLMANLKIWQQDWVEDPSNQNENFTRIKIRSLLKSSNIDGLNSARLSLTSQRMRRVRSLLEDLTEKAESEYVSYHELGFATLQANFNEKLHEEISLRLLSKILQYTSGGQYAPRHNKLNSLYENLKQDTFSGQTLLGCIVFSLSKNEFIFAREENSIDSRINVSDTELVLWDNRFFINKTENIHCFSQKTLILLKQEYPEIKDKLNTYFGHSILSKRIMPTLPCQINDEGKVMLPEKLALEIGMPKLNGFSATLKNNP